MKHTLFVDAASKDPSDHAASEARTVRPATVQ